MASSRRLTLITVLLLILLIPFLLGAVLIGAGDRLGRKAFAIAAMAPAATLVWLAAHWGQVFPHHGSPVSIGQRVDWIRGLDLAIDLRVDAFGALMLLLVAGIGLGVCIFAVSYFSPAPDGTGRLAGLILLFAGSMTGLVLSDHVIALFVFWELTSITSYLLIGNDDRNPRARDAALHALLLTGAGGLAMLAGLLLIGQAADTYSLAAMVTAVADGQVTGNLVTAGVVLVLVGAFAKSAQWPLSGWLPGAMVAPTPISTYLHAATMVKAGVYLVGRLAPLFADIEVWRPLVLSLGSLTMVYGGWRALRQFDLKLLLAYGTVSQLGFLMVLFGAGTYSLAQAAVVVIVAHAAFKATLFMVVGVIDHQTHNRDIRRIRSLGAPWRPVQVMAIIACASMAGLPPMLGFIGKEKALLSAARSDLGSPVPVLAVIVVGSMLTVAYAGRFILGLWGRYADQTATDDDHPMIDGNAAAPSWLFIAPAGLLALWSLVSGLWPALVDTMVRSATRALYPASTPPEVELWSGWNTAVTWSTVIVAVGVVLILLRGQVTRIQSTVFRGVSRVPNAERSFWAVLQGSLTGAKKVTGVVQNGSLPLYVMITLGVVTAVGAVPAAGVVDDLPRFTESWIHLPVLGLVAAAALGASVTHRRIGAALLLGATGYGMAIFFVVQGAPDLALTQFAIETLATVLFVLVLRLLPRQFTDRRPVFTAPTRVIVAVGVGIGTALLALAASQPRDPAERSPVAQTMLERSLPDGKGANVVNVILVDFRGLDTLGEITVLLVAALGVITLTRTLRPSDPVVEEPHSVIVSTSNIVLFASICMLSLYFLFAGHNQPGGGFVGGLTAGGAIGLAFIGGGLAAVRRLIPVTSWVVVGAGLATSAVTALTPVFLGHRLLEHALFTLELPWVGRLKFTSALFFDIGVYLVVVGLVLMVYEAFGERAERLEVANL